MRIEVHAGGYRGSNASGHVVLTGLADALNQVGYRLQRVEKGENWTRPAIDVSLQRPPAVIENVDVPLTLAVAPYSGQKELNARVTLVGLTAYLQGGFGLRRNDELTIRVFIPNLDGDYLAAGDADVGAGAGPPGDRPRDRVMRAIRARRGAPAFRAAQLARFASRCAVSGCTLVDVLEAAHIRAYRTDEQNAATNGILLRADVHTLFDLDLIAIRPESYAIAVHASVAEAQYRQYDGQQVRPPQDGFDVAALLARWDLFRAKLS